jgi:hypothetical protein
LVKNPGYERWKRYEPGSWVLAEGQQTVDGVTRPVRVKVTLVSKSANRLVYRREVLTPEGKQDEFSIPTTVYESAHVAPDENPITHPDARVKDLPDTTVRVGSREFACKVRSVSTPADFHAWGSHPQATVCYCDEVPGGIVQMHIKTRLGKQSVEVTGKAVDYHAVTN